DLLHRQRHHLHRLLSVSRDVDNLTAKRREELLLRLLDGKGISTATLAARRRALLRQADAQTRGLADQLLPLQRRLADLLLQGHGKRSPQQYRDDCLGLERQIDALERDLGLRVQEFALLQKAHTATPTELAAHLTPGMVVVETARYHPWLWSAAAAKKEW